MLSTDADVVQLFMELAAIPSPSGRERALGEQVRQWLAEHDIAAEFDGCGEHNDSDAGNLIATVPGAPGRPKLLFVAHLDTVETGAPTVRPRLDDGVIRSAGDTILGADNKSAVAALLRTLATVARRPPAERPTVLGALTCREEAGRMGASLLEPGVLAVDHAFSVDGSQPIGTVITRALGQTTFVVAVHGRAAHAAADPEAGINAIAVAGEAVAALPLGRLPEGGSANVAAIIGGSVIGRLGPGQPDAPIDALASAPTNSVPDVAWLRGEVRGYSVEEIEGTAQAIADIVSRVCADRGATCEWRRDPQRMVPPLTGAPGSGALALVSAAVGRVDGAVLDLQEAHATLEANYLAPHVDVVAVASGGSAPHQTSESITVEELRRLEALLTEIVDLAVSG